MITVLTGKNYYLLNQYKKDIINKYTEKYGDYSVEILNAGELSNKDILNSINSLPFLVTNKLIIITDILLNKDFVDKIDEIIVSDNENVEILIYEQNFDKRSSLYKNLKKKTNFKEFSELDDQQLANWLIDLAKLNSYKLSRSEINYLIQRVGTNQQKLFNELSKLTAYSNTVTRENIDLLTKKSIKSTTFDMLDSLFQGNIKKAIEYYNEQRTLNIEPQMIIGSLVWQLRVILAVKYSKEGIDQTAKLTKFSPYSLRKAEQLADKLSKNQLKNIVNSILLLDIDSKSKPIDIDQAIKHKMLVISEQLK